MLSSEQLNNIQWLKQHHISGFQLNLEELMLYRKYTYLLANKPNARIKHHLSGQYLAKTKGRGMEFDEARHYQPGDDVRTIDWRVTARTGKTHTKLFREEKDRPVFVFCDLLPTMRFGSQLLFKSIQACHLSALIAWRAKENGDKVGGLILSEQNLFEAKPRGRQKAVLNWLDALMTHHNQLPIKHDVDLSVDKLNEKFVEACAHLRRVAHPGSLVYLVSDFQHLNETALQHLYQLQKHCEVVACWINDPIEHSLPNQLAMGLPITDGNKMKTVESQNQILEYKRRSASLFAKTKSEMTQFNIRWLPLSAGLPLHQQL